eukprot:6483055-Amphidinium_carterae.1
MQSLGLIWHARMHVSDHHHSDGPSRFDDVRAMRSRQVKEAPTHVKFPSEQWACNLLPRSNSATLRVET